MSFMKKVLNAKRYVTFAQTENGMLICVDGESNQINGIQARASADEEILADCYWTKKDGVKQCPIMFSTYTDENGRIIGGIFIQGGSMKSPVITDFFEDIKPDADYKVMVHVWDDNTGYLWTNINQTHGLTRADYLIMSDILGQKNPVQELIEQCYFKKNSMEETSHEKI